VLQALGVKNVQNLAGGILYWNRLGLPLRRDGMQVESLQTSGR